jgi:hypothetical protein
MSKQNYEKEQGLLSANIQKYKKQKIMNKSKRIMINKKNKIE